jgi:hydroxymethylbilane synthase
MKSHGPLRLGTRGSALALWQAEWVAARLRERSCPVELVRIQTTGDVTSQPLQTVGGQGLFTKELQRALLDQRIDLAVHSLKDLPTEPVSGLELVAVPPRESCCDAFVSTRAPSIDTLPAGARVGTGSRRRKSQLLHHRSDLQILDIRGNVDTRLRKLDEGQYDALVLAEAGLRRLGWSSRIAQLIPSDIMLPAVGQGALGIEARNDDAVTRDWLSTLNDADSFHAVEAERAMLSELRAGCLAPVAAWGRVMNGQLLLDGAVLSCDGQHRIAATAAGNAANARAIGKQVAQDLLIQGASTLIAAARGDGVMR